jgi:hypothetical protein
MIKVVTAIDPTTATYPLWRVPGVEGGLVFYDADAGEYVWLAKPPGGKEVGSAVDVNLQLVPANEAARQEELQ